MDMAPRQKDYQEESLHQKVDRLQRLVEAGLSPEAMSLFRPVRLPGPLTIPRRLMRSSTPRYWTVSMPSRIFGHKIKGK